MGGTGHLKVGAQVGGVLRAGKQYNCYSPNLVPDSTAGSPRGLGFGETLLCSATVRIYPGSQRPPLPRTSFSFLV